MSSIAGTTTLQQFLLPDVGEGLTEADILKWLVAPGERVALNQVIVEIETAKAAVEIPSPYAGIVSKLLVSEGQTVAVGAPVIEIAVAGPSSGAAEGADAEAGFANKAPAVLVGYGPHSSTPSRRPRRSATPPAPVPATSTATAAAATVPPPRHAALAKPPVRKLAKDLGVDLTDIVGTGPDGVVTREDVTAASGRSTDAARPVVTADEERMPVRGVHKAMAQAMVASAFTAPHAGLFVTVDVSAMMELRDRVAARREFRDVRVTPLLFVARAVAWALRRNPMMNARWDDATGDVVLRRQINLGIAVASDRGLLVPNVRDAGSLSLLELAESIDALVETAREGRSKPADMSGGTFSITNVGVFGVDGGIPILNPGESGILAFGAIDRRPWVVEVDGEERIVPRWVTTLTLSLDHRVVDGAQAAAMLADVAAVLTDPGLALL